MTFIDKGTNDNSVVGTFVDINGTNSLGGLAVVGHRKDNQSGLVLRGQNKVANSGAVNGYITSVIGNAYSDNALTTLTTGVTGKSISFLGQDTELANLNFNGDLTITNGNLVVASGKGIDFSATSNGSGTTTSELLNDYEEGEWTPTFTTGTSGTITVDTVNTKARYTKIGRQVTVAGSFYVTSVSSPVGEWRIQGLPFTSNTGTSLRSAVSVFADGLETTATTSIIGYVDPNVTYITLYKYAAGVVSTMAADVKAGSYVFLTATYNV